MLSRTISLALVLGLGSSCGAADESPRDATDGTIRGITISTHTDGRDWARDEIRPTMRRIKELGANWVTIHPYASIRSDGSVRFRPVDPANPPEHIVRPIREAHALGLKILIKPHLAYWGSPFDWRGEIAFDSEAEWRRFFDDYRRWIVALASVTREADGFAVGTELDATLGRESEWRAVIAAVREVTPSPLTYAANWSEYERVPFWGALDAIGIQAYFPLTGEDDLTEEAIGRGWAGWMERLREFSIRQERHIVFTELGYNDSRFAPVRPWDPRPRGEGQNEIQAACMRTALNAVRDEPRVIGAFLWKWFPEPHPVGRDFQLATPGMSEIIRQVWRE